MRLQAGGVREYGLGMALCTLLGSVEDNTDLALPFPSMRVPAGFPSPADDYLEKTLSLNELLVRHPAATFMMRVEGDSMIGAGIHDGDILIVDRAIEAAHGSIVVALLNGEFMVKRLKLRGGRGFLASENPKYREVPIGETADFEVWGVVTNVIHALK